MAIDASKLDIALEEKEGWRRTLSVTVPASLVRTEREKIVRRLASRLNLKGFRKGQVPSRVVEQRYGPALQQETVEAIIGEAYRKALETQSLRPISEGEVDRVDYEPEQDLTFDISFDVQPEIRIARLGGFEVTRPTAEVGDDEVEKVVDRLRDQNAAWQPVEEGTPEAGDLVSLKVVMLKDGEPEPEAEAQAYELVLGEGDAIPDVESAVYTLEPGETGDFDVTFPDDFPDPDRRGEVQNLRITLEGRKVKDLPEADDEFARSLGDFDDLETLKARVREDLEKEAEQQAEGAVRGQLLEYLVEANPFDVPVSMVDRYIESVLGDTSGADEEAVARAREQIRPEAERAVKRIMVIETIADSQDLRATEDEVDDRIQEIAEKNDTTPARVYGRLQKAGRLESLEREITEKKVFDFLKEKSTVRDAD